MKKCTFLMAALLCGAWCATAQNTDNGHEYVDLGLSVKWATCNVGATAPEEYGYYYAWGETAPKETYAWSTYFDTPDGGSTFTKYTIDGKTTLDPDDDAAATNWGDNWRMPTDAEWTELRTKCTWTWTALNGNSIFLPAAGYRNNDDLSSAGNNGYYWSSSLYTDDPGRAWYVYFYSGSVYCGSLRCFGLSVRPVVDKSGSTTALQPATAAVNIYTQNGRIVCEGDFRIYDLLGRDVTRLNGSLFGVYVVKTADSAVKVVVK